MNMTLNSILILFTISIIMMSLSIMISKKSLMDKEKMSPFECGFNPMSNKRLPFSLHFFFIAIIFLIFDIEIVIIMPMIYTMKFSLIKFWMMTSITFTIILIVGLYFEWNKGLLKWSN
uniref:NADH-ubiquinone oxidoreductase chain 3 n=1 Tax=Mesargus serrata TaxID=2901391 RepID=A0A8K2AU14_9HEMI|nr:NADH dehydrogenase subunit 3 [Mesargus serrata]